MNEIFKRLPSSINNYYEIFVGGGSVLIEICKLKQAGLGNIGYIHAYDINHNLINMYRCIRQQYIQLYKELNKLS